MIRVEVIVVRFMSQRPMSLISHRIKEAGMGSQGLLQARCFILALGCFGRLPPCTRLQAVAAICLRLILRQFKFTN